MHAAICFIAYYRKGREKLEEVAHPVRSFGTGPVADSGHSLSDQWRTQSGQSVPDQWRTQSGPSVLDQSYAILSFIAQRPRNNNYSLQPHKFSSKKIKIIHV